MILKAKYPILSRKFFFKNDFKFFYIYSNNKNIYIKQSTKIGPMIPQYTDEKINRHTTSHNPSPLEQRYKKESKMFILGGPFLAISCLVWVTIISLQIQQLWIFQRHCPRYFIPYCPFAIFCPLVNSYIEVELYLVILSSNW